jgi:hypothetical protein
MGGTSDEEVAFGPGNLISLCRDCHSWVHAHPAQSYEQGYLVHSRDNPELIKIFSSLGVLMVHSDGTSELEACGGIFLHCEIACRDAVDERE